MSLVGNPLMDPLDDDLITNTDVVESQAACYRVEGIVELQ